MKMKCPDDNILMAYIDGETDEIEAHCQECPACRDKLRQLRREAEAVNTLLVSLQELPQAAAIPENRLAERRWSKVKRNSRWVAAAAALILVLVFTVTPARSLAIQLLGLFRAEHVKIVDLTQTDMKDLQELLNQYDSLEIEQLGTFSREQEGDYCSYESFDAAQAAAPYNLNFPLELDGVPFNRISAYPAEVMHYSPDVIQVNALLAQMGSTTMLPESLEGKTVTFSMGPVFETAYFIDNSPVRLMQAPPPSVSGTAGMEEKVFWEALAGLPFLPTQLQTALEQNPFRATTFLFPRVEGVNDGEMVIINGSEGVFSTLEKSREHLLLWPQGDHWNLMLSSLDKDRMLSLAKQVSNP